MHAWRAQRTGCSQDPAAKRADRHMHSSGAARWYINEDACLQTVQVQVRAASRQPGTALTSSTTTAAGERRFQAHVSTWHHMMLANQAVPAAPHVSLGARLPVQPAPPVPCNSAGHPSANKADAGHSHARMGEKSMPLRFKRCGGQGGQDEMEQGGSSVCRFSMHRLIVASQGASASAAGQPAASRPARPHSHSTARLHCTAAALRHAQDNAAPVLTPGAG